MRKLLLILTLVPTLLLASPSVGFIDLRVFREQSPDWLKGVIDFFQAFWDHSEEIERAHLEEFDLLFHEVIGEKNLFFWGLDPGVVDQGYVGEGEISNQVRITAINGILNKKISALHAVQTISELHGGVNVHYVYWPSEGWTKDMYKSFAAKIGNISHVAKELAKTWRRLIEEMGGIESEGEIIHYAHSIGSVETYCAKMLMTSEEVAKIRVYTFGSPYLFPNEDFKEVTHYLSVRDGVPMLDGGYFDADFDTKDHIQFVGTLDGLPLIDHFLVNGIYIEVVAHLALDFIDRWGTLP